MCLICFCTIFYSVYFCIWWGSSYLLRLICVCIVCWIVSSDLYLCCLVHRVCCVGFDALLAPRVDFVWSGSTLLATPFWLSDLGLQLLLNCVYCVWSWSALSASICLRYLVWVCTILDTVSAVSDLLCTLNFLLQRVYCVWSGSALFATLCLLYLIWVCTVWYTVYNVTDLGLHCLLHCLCIWSRSTLFDTLCLIVFGLGLYCLLYCIFFIRFRSTLCTTLYILCLVWVFYLCYNLSSLSTLCLSV